MLSFDLFHWSSENGPWISGWSIPKNTRDVNWRIYVTNLDNREITLSSQSSFSLVGNDNIPNSYLAWYLDPAKSDTNLVPDEIATIIFGSEDITKFSEEITCKNFLLFTGYFTEANGSKTPFGQTIPFEAVLITGEKMVATITITANPGIIQNDGTSYSTITATVRDSAGNVVADKWVDLFTNAGTLSQLNAKTDALGRVQVTLTSSNQETTANVYALCQGITGNCKVAFTQATKLRVTANPTIILKTGDSQITVQLLDKENNPFSQSGIDITVAVSWSGNQAKIPKLIYEGQSAISVTITTDSTGSARLILRGNGDTGTATITASAIVLTTGNTPVVLT